MQLWHILPPFWKKNEIILHLIKNQFRIKWRATTEIESEAEATRSQHWIHIFELGYFVFVPLFDLFDIIYKTITRKSYENVFFVDVIVVGCWLVLMRLISCVSAWEQ